MRELDPLEHEEIFFQEMRRRIPELQDWYHQDPDGGPWMLVSYDFVEGNAVRETLRVDYDGTQLRGGWSPSCLNWDDGVRAAEALIDTGPPDGLSIDLASDPREVAAIAAAWFEAHIERWNRRP
ncbi:hypothetical protein [Jidongwangia harbinensis]|uniref:hypothetical protein n=1 Tax=Jidongwangia harbinensis TaxID=2878561 RepID=UPI001CDA4E1F|nr:hypothetical protein [Jidongwangia harbinensis]MCA2213001.1 hypothetical protein [Jidongwangia harbinensis]